MEYTDKAYDSIDCEIGEEADSGGFITLTPGDYPFTIEQPIERVKFSGSEKIPPCWRVDLKLKVDAGPQGTTNVPYSLFLTTGRSWRVKQLFVGLGLIDPNAKKFTPPWNALVGSSGVAKIGNRTYNGNTYNDVKQILDPKSASEAIAKQMLEADAAPSAAPATTQGSMFNFPKG